MKYFRKICWEYQSTYFTFNNSFFLRNSCRLWDNVEKYGRIRHATDGNIIQRMRFLSRITEAGIKTHEYNNYVYWTLHHLDSWIKRDQLDVTCFFISLFNAQHVSDVNTSILRSLRLICWVVSWVVLLWYDVCWCYVVVWLGWCGIRMPQHPSQTTTQHQHTSYQSNTTHEITQHISRKLLRMDVLTSETCWALNNEIKKQVTSSWSLFIQREYNI